jgi:hypothetical protein
MLNSLWTRLLIPFLPAVVVAGCAGGFSSDAPAPAEPAATIVVGHDLPAAVSLTVHLIDPTGRVRRLGTVPAGAVVTFPVRDPIVSGDYRLVAETADGRSLSSPGFILTGRDRVRWAPSANTVVPEQDSP